MLVNYAASPVGPYRELLYVGGFFKERGRVRPSVTRILVDSAASLTAGRAYWGLPKELAHFAWEERYVRVTQGGRLLAEFGWQAGRGELPVSTAFIPAFLRTLAQPWQEGVLFTTVGAAGRVRFARLSHALVNPALFPDVTPHKPLLTLEVAHVRLRFPPAVNG